MAKNFRRANNPVKTIIPPTTVSKSPNSFPTAPARMQTIVRQTTHYKISLLFDIGSFLELLPPQYGHFGVIWQSILVKVTV